MEEHLSFWASFMHEAWIRDAVIVAMLAGAVCAYVGVFIVLKRMVFVSAALSSMSGVGVASAFYLASVFGVAPMKRPCGSIRDCSRCSLPPSARFSSPSTWGTAASPAKPRSASGTSSPPRSSS